HVLAFGDTLVGSDAPIAFDAAVVRARMREPFTARHYARAGIDIEAVLQEPLERGPRVIGPEHDRAPYLDINTDLFPKDEYLASRRFLPGGRER
ncbi:MAG TPA: hypothetical protein VLI67_07940, partial [Vicinamibacteria bacterium]|nr:hypothetical protein [Vicinamibacteria bacterium]